MDLVQKIADRYLAASATLTDAVMRADPSEGDPEDVAAKIQADFSQAVVDTLDLTKCVVGSHSSPTTKRYDFFLEGSAGRTVQLQGSVQYPRSLTVTCSQRVDVRRLWNVAVESSVRGVQIPFVSAWVNMEVLEAIQKACVVEDIEDIVDERMWESGAATDDSTTTYEEEGHPVPTREGVSARFNFNFIVDRVDVVVDWRAGHADVHIKMDLDVVLTKILSPWA